jgi:chromate reductase
MRVLGISGSLRRDSYSTALLRHAGEIFEAEGAEFEIYDGLRDVPAYDEDCDIEQAPTAVSRIREAVRGADALFFVTPEYNSSLPGALKNALDWISRPFATNAMGARVTEGEVAVGNAGERVDENGRLSEPSLEQEVHEVITALLADALTPARSA